MNKKLILLFPLALAFALLSPKLSTKQTSQTLSATPVNQEKSVSKVNLSYGDGKSDTFDYNFEGAKTAFDALEEMADQKSIKIESQKYDFGVFIKSIAGYVNSADKAWIFYINGNSADKAADKYELRHGDVVEWKYIQPI